MWNETNSTPQPNEIYILEMQNWFNIKINKYNYINWIKEKTTCNILVGTKQHFIKINFLHAKPFIKVGVCGNFDLKRGFFKGHIINIIDGI